MFSENRLSRAQRSFESTYISCFSFFSCKLVSYVLRCACCIFHWINCLFFFFRVIVISYSIPGSADKTVKFWDLETFELIGSAGPEVNNGPSY